MIRHMQVHWPPSHLQYQGTHHLKCLPKFISAFEHLRMCTSGLNALQGHNCIQQWHDKISLLRASWFASFLSFGLTLSSALVRWLTSYYALTYHIVFKTRRKNLKIILTNISNTV